MGDHFPDGPREVESALNGRGKQSVDVLQSRKAQGFFFGNFQLLVNERCILHVEHVRRRNAQNCSAESSGGREVFRFLREVLASLKQGMQLSVEVGVVEGVFSH